jgi:hypothetical protein
MKPNLSGQIFGAVEMASNSIADISREISSIFRFRENAVTNSVCHKSTVIFLFNDKGQFIHGNLRISSQHFDGSIMFPPVDDTRNLFGLLAVFAEDAELVFAMFAVPDGEFSAEEHRDAHFAGIGGDGVLSHGHWLFYILSRSANSRQVFKPRLLDAAKQFPVLFGTNRRVT